MSVVVDASVALAWHFPGEATAQTERLLDDVVEKGAVVPVHWRAEIANGFAIAVRRGRLESAYRAQALLKLSTLSIVADEESDVELWNATQTICDRFRLTAYDAAYLELAQRRRLPLATLDSALLRAARDVGIKTVALSE